MHSMNAIATEMKCVMQCGRVQKALIFAQSLNVMLLSPHKILFATTTYNFSHYNKWNSCRAGWIPTSFFISTLSLQP